MSTPDYPHLDCHFMRRMFWGRIFGLFIKELRVEKGRSVVEAARLAGMDVRED